MRVEKVADLLSSALRTSGEWFLLLEFWPTPDEEADWSWMSWSLPWLPELGDARGTLCGDLRRHGIGLLAVEGEEEARRCFERIQGFRVSATVFTSAGDRLLWEPAERRPRRGG
jgi:hypothetical protein